MKKILLCLTVLFTAILLTGCGKEKVSLNLKDLSSKIDNLKEEEFSRLSASYMLDEKIAGLESVYDFDFQEKFGINKENIESYSVSINESTKDMYFIVKPLDGKKNTVKEEIDKYIETLDDTAKGKLTYEEYQGYLIYIIAENSKSLMNDAKKSTDNVFGSLQEVNDDLLSQQFGIEKEDVDEYLIKTPMMITSSNSYIIVKPADGKKEEVKNKLDEYMKNLEEQWKTYLPTQYELVKNRLEEEYGDYLIYIISSNNKLVFDTIKANNLK